MKVIWGKAGPGKGGHATFSEEFPATRFNGRLESRRARPACPLGLGPGLRPQVANAALPLARHSLGDGGSPSPRRSLPFDLAQGSPSMVERLRSQRPPWQGYGPCRGPLR